MNTVRYLMCCILHRKVIDRGNPSQYILECYSPNNCNETGSNQQQDVKAKQLKFNMRLQVSDSLWKTTVYKPFYFFIYWIGIRIKIALSTEASNKVALWQAKSDFNFYCTSVPFIGHSFWNMAGVRFCFLSLFVSWKGTIMALPWNLHHFLLVHLHQQ